jgi:carboxyl-terminal processing protease
MTRPTAFILALALLLAIVSSNAADPSVWRVQLESQALGPVEFHLELSTTGGRLRGRSLSGSSGFLAEMSGDHHLDDGLMVFEAREADDETWRGEILAPWPDGSIFLTVGDDTLEGTIDSGMLAGSLSGEKVGTAPTIRDYPAIVDSFDEVVASRVFSPDDLDETAYRDFRAGLGHVARLATDDLDLLIGFRLLWKSDPFSHFLLQRSDRTAAQLFEHFDNYRVGFEAATVEFDDDVAILTVRTMMGADTIEQVEAAYDRIAAAAPSALIIDLRGNSGGAFAVKPLVEHVIDVPLDAGYFLSQAWNREHDTLPPVEAVLAAEPWRGWSIVAFWKAVQEMDIVRLRFEPAAPNFDGPVYVLLDDVSASATELAADALRSSGVTTLVGRRTAGQMLSQSMFDLADGFIVSLPVADYFSMVHGRIEGAGVPVDVEVEPGEALDVARALAQKRISGAN